MKLRQPLNKIRDFKLRSYSLIMSNLYGLLEEKELRIPHITFKVISDEREQTEEERLQRISVPIKVQFSVETKAIDREEILSEVGSLIFKR